MKLFRYALLLCVAFAVTACGRVANCSTPEVKDTVLSIAMENVDNQRWQDAIMAGEVRNITTESSDAENGNYSCSAQLYHPGYANGPITKDVVYSVKAIADGGDGNDFQIEYEQLPYYMWSATVGAHELQSSQ